MSQALIGHSGFVGTTLLKQKQFDSLYRSTNIGEISGQSFDLVVCAAAPAQKWAANLNPETDLQIIEGLIKHLETIQCGRFVLVSTVDVFKKPVGVDEDSEVDESGLHPYGLHRRMLEKFVESHFPGALIVRLPGLVGPGLRKNIIFDFLNNNDLQKVDSRGIFQFYPMVNLWYDIHIAIQSGLTLIHLTAAPVSVSEISEDGFGRPFVQSLENPPATYDMQSKYAALFGGHGSYQYSKRETIQSVRSYAQSEPVTIKTEKGTG